MNRLFFQHAVHGVVFAGEYAMSKKKAPFNPGFQDLENKLSSRNQKKSKSITPKEESRDLFDEDVLAFTEAMSDVRPLRGKRKIVPKARGSNARPSHPAANREREVIEHLRGLIEGSVQLDITFSDEYMEGAVKGFSRKLMKKLKQGLFPIQDYIDLHGLTTQEAEREVGHFLVASHKLGLRCVLIVHGRGLNSPDSEPVLKEKLPVWLNRGPSRKIVLAFATAKPYDGGTGAVYVLLRKR
jgi:DNA-nicking Smr family endonuclease